MTEIVRTLGRYELHHRIAAGGMGEIFVAKSHGAGGFEKTVIIKTILPHLADDPEFVTKFLDEGRIVVNLTHGNIVPVFDMGEENGEYFIAMEYVAGRDLRDVLRHLKAAGRQLPVELSLYILIELSKGLGYAHQKTDAEGVPLGIVHRDVSPSNVLLSREGEVKLIDFGIARATGKLSVTMSGRLQGKCCYMSPEQASGKVVDARSDIFSAGVLLYELLTGVRPFEGDSDLETLEQVRLCEFDPPGVLNPEVDAELDEIVSRALERDPQARYQTIEEMQIALTQRLYGSGNTVTSRDVARLLAELFPEGVEPEAHRIGRGGSRSGMTPSGLDLDAALNLELERLGLGDEGGETLTPAAGIFVNSASGGISGGGAEPFEETVSSIALPVVTKTEAEPFAEQRQESAAADRAEAEETEAEEFGEVVPAEHAGRRGSKRWLGVALMLGVLLGSGLVFWLVGASAEGTIVLESEPPGARIFVNGAQLVGKTTPYALEMPAGLHNIQLALDGYETRSFTLELGRRQVLALAGADAVLQPVQPVQTTRPVDENDKNEKAAEVVSVVEAAPEPVEKVPVQAEENAPDEKVTEKVTEKKTPPVRPTRVERKVPVRIESRPAGARIEVNGNSLGTAPVRGEYAGAETLRVRAELAGYAAKEGTYVVSRLQDGQIMMELSPLEMGCLDFRAMEPAHNELAINGRRLEGRRMMLKGHPLPVGEHTITVRNPDAGREETFSFTIEPGPRCTYLGVWEPER